MAAISANQFNYVRELLYHASGIALDHDKGYLVESRLQSLARREGMPLEDLLNRLKGPESDRYRSKVVEAMTTNETSFFRDVHPFSALRNPILSTLATRRGGNVTIWCGACSSGQEPYSIAMAVHEHLPSLVSRIRVIATDISTEMLEITDAGVFSQMEVNRGLPAPLLLRFFDRNGFKWRIKPELRRMLTLRQLNLVAPSWPGLPVADVIFLRNVLIYFDTDTKKAVLERVRRHMAPDGYLFLGNAETTLNLDPSFKRCTLDRATCYRLQD